MATQCKTRPAGRRFSPEELEEIRRDMARCRSIRIVAELHACGQDDIRRAMGEELQGFSLCHDGRKFWTREEWEEIVKMRRHGYTNGEIARRFGVKRHSIESQITKIKREGLL